MKKSKESRVLLILLALVLTLSLQTAGVFGVEDVPEDEGAPAVETDTTGEEVPADTELPVIEAGDEEADPGAEAETQPAAEEPAAAPAEDEFQMTLPTVYLHITRGDDGKEGQHGHRGIRQVLDLPGSLFG